MSSRELTPKCNCKAFEKQHAEFQHEARAIIPVKDKKHPTEYRYINESKNHLAKYRIDGGVISDGNKCDFLLLNCEQKKSYFIELKGSDLSHAIKQIETSIDSLKKYLPGFEFYARIVLTRVNTIGLMNEKILRLERKVKSLNGNFKKGTRVLEEKI